MLLTVAVVEWRGWRRAGHVPPELVPAAKASIVSTAVLFAAVLTAWSWTAP